MGILFAQVSLHTMSSYLLLFHSSVDSQAALGNARPKSCRWGNCGNVYPSKKPRSSLMPTAMQ